MCDQNAADCFKRNEFNPRYSNYDKGKCLTTNGLNEQIEEEVLDDMYIKNGLK